ncbi:ribosomal protein L24, putative [Babesia bigemina]|uniref:Ribosomal protein L24, putative n=1 Tax=Babesia bigemina TaxID=5866 RepID=A0A061D168_BABBI|nr:ribosomal protein L24, putative [Babesia bigemina]CDR93842.1 ribosomal protein L24, putative [Babesia bigemina]|eukprot:XP_012766028.1 ribosomal protein L24, putative [Babesia bigemina]
MAKYVKAQFQALQMTRNRRVPERSYFLHFSKYNSIPKPLSERRQPRRVDIAACLNMQVGDLVQVLHGQDQNRQGVILKIFHRKNQLIVENCNMRQTFWNPDFRKGQPSLLTQEMPIHVTNVALVDPVVKKPTIVKRRYMMNGECVRICKLSGCALPKPVEVARSLYKPPPKKATPVKDDYSHRDYENFNILVGLAREIKNRKIATLLSDRAPLTKCRMDGAEAPEQDDTAAAAS